MYIVYKKTVFKNRYVHPSWATYTTEYDWKISNPKTNEVLISTSNKNAKNDVSFSPVEVDEENAKILVEQYTDNKKTLFEGKIVEKLETNQKHTWKDCIEFEREFTLEELNMINNYEYFINTNEKLSDGERTMYMLYMNTIMKTYEKQITSGKQFFNTDTTLQDMFKVLYDVGFLSAERINSILKLDLIKE